MIKKVPKYQYDKAIKAYLSYPNSKSVVDLSKVLLLLIGIKNNN